MDATEGGPMTRNQWALAEEDERRSRRRRTDLLVVIATVGVVVFLFVGVVVLAAWRAGDTPPRAAGAPNVNPVAIVQPQPLPAKDEKDVRVMWGEGDAEFSPVKVRIASVASSWGLELTNRAGRAATYNQPCFAVKVVVHVTDPAKRVDYHSWANKAFGRPQRPAVLVDDAGNTYSPLQFNDAMIPNGGIEYATVDSATPANDILVFDMPPPGVKWLDLDLPIHAGADRGFIKFRIQTRHIAK